MDGHGFLYSRKQAEAESHIEDYIYGASLNGEYRRSWKGKRRNMRYSSLILIQEGSLECTIDGRNGISSAGELKVIPSWAEVSSICYSPDFRGTIIGVGNEPVTDIFRNNNPFPMDFLYGMTGNNDYLRLNESEAETVLSDMESIIASLGNKSHHYLREINYARLYILVTDLADILWKRFGKGMPNHLINMSRPDAIMQQFTELLGQEIEKESSIGYYAEKLCISKQYLSLIVKAKTRNPIGKVIATMRAERAIRLLRSTSLSIKQIADRLSFPDQSSFGKFMKRYLGMSPARYRSNLRKNMMPPPIINSLGQ